MCDGQLDLDLGHACEVTVGLKTAQNLNSMSHQIAFTNSSPFSVLSPNSKFSLLSHITFRNTIRLNSTFRIESHFNLTISKCVNLGLISVLAFRVLKFTL